jgi:hypothetical protein
MAIPLERRLPLVAALAQDLGLFVFEGFLGHPLRGQSD